MASTTALAIVIGSSDLKIPEPTNTPSIPNCIISAASAGVAIPPAVNVTTGSLPSLLISSKISTTSASIVALSFPNGLKSVDSPRFVSASSSRTKNLLQIFLAMISKFSDFFTTSISACNNLACLIAATTFPVPASPFVLIIAAPSHILLTASPSDVAPHTKGTVKSSLTT